MMSGKKAMIAVYALTEKSSESAAQLAEALDEGESFVPSEFSTEGEGFSPGGLPAVIKENWSEFEGHVFIMETGKVIENIAGLMNGGGGDPAVVVCDGSGRFAISLLGGRALGADRLAEKVASITGGDAVLTSTAETTGAKTFDEMADVQGWRVENPRKLGVLNRMLLGGEKVAMKIPKEVFLQMYEECPNALYAESLSEILPAGIVVLDEDIPVCDIPVLRLSSK